ncbi:Dot/Icm T4SS effector CoxCC15 [Coxiella burnetii]|uniref:Dot/Icm T4SS effector CoxCC15 n=1 Tax=Coxiella burnetii TaxID=777 RepID=UPI002176109A|nr:Dot/Icm T4SS effector CoxCC15 [Coxiella burnetii]
MPKNTNPDPRLSLIASKWYEERKKTCPWIKAQKPTENTIGNFVNLIKNPSDELINPTLEALLLEDTVITEHLPFSGRIGHLLRASKNLLNYEFTHQEVQELFKVLSLKELLYFSNMNGVFKKLREFNFTKEAIFEAVLKIKEKRENEENVSLLEELMQCLQKEQEPSRVPVRMETPPQSPDFNSGNSISTSNPSTLLVSPPPPGDLLKERDEPMNSPSLGSPSFFFSPPPDTLKETVLLRTPLFNPESSEGDSLLRSNSFSLGNSLFSERNQILCLSSEGGSNEENEDNEDNDLVNACLK